MAWRNKSAALLRPSSEAAPPAVATQAVLIPPATVLGPSSVAPTARPSPVAPTAVPAPVAPPTSSDAQGRLPFKPAPAGASVGLESIDYKDVEREGDEFLASIGSTSYAMPHVKCSCCNDDPENCQQPDCKSFGICFCVFDEPADQDADFDGDQDIDAYYPESASCTCCRGRPYNCPRMMDLCQSGLDICACQVQVGDGMDPEPPATPAPSAPSTARAAYQQQKPEQPAATAAVALAFSSPPPAAAAAQPAPAPAPAAAVVADLAPSMSRLALGGTLRAQAKSFVPKSRQ